MNNRMYDPVAGRMLAVDNFVQDPYSTQSYNRYSYCWNNPLKFTDPSGDIIWFAPIIFGAMLGAAQGHIYANQNGATGWDMAGYVMGGAVIGAASAWVGGTLAEASFAGHSTASIVSTSVINSAGWKVLSGGKSDFAINYGFGSYNFTKGTHDFLFDGDNTGIENFGYFLGAWSNVSDAFSFVMGAYGSVTGTINLATENHSALTEPGTNKTLLSVGGVLDDGSAVPHEPRNAFRSFKLVTDYKNNIDQGATLTPINNVRVDKINEYANSLSNSGVRYKLTSIFPTNTMHCAIGASRALLRAGVFNIPVGRIPFTLNLQMAIRQVSQYGQVVNLFNQY